MAAVLTGSPVAINWAAGSAPAAQNITIPADATAVYFFFEYYEGVNGFGINTVTLNGASPNQLSEIVNLGSPNFESCTGVAVWYNPPTGSRSLQVTWDTNPGEGPSCAVAFVKDGDTTAARDIEHGHGGGTTAVSFALTTAAGDLVLKFDRRYDGGGSTPPSLSSGWTNGVTCINNSSSSRLSYKTAAGSSETINCEDENYSSATAISIPAFASPTATLSAPSATPGTTTATIGATTDQANGTFYAVVDTAANLAGVTATQIKAGQKASGSAALAANNAAVSTTSPSVGVTGLSATTLYSFAAVQNNANGDSNVVTGTFHTTGAVGRLGQWDPSLRIQGWF